MVDLILYQSLWLSPVDLILFKYLYGCLQGLKIKTELAGLVKDLPQELSKLAESAQSLNDAVQFYDSFTQFLLNKWVFVFFQ